MLSIKQFRVRDDLKGGHGFPPLEGFGFYGGGGGGGDTTTVQKADPWEGQQPFLTDTFSQAQNLYNNYAPQYYPNSLVADQSSATQGYLDSLAAFNSSPGNQQLLSQAQAGTDALFNLSGGGNYLQQIGSPLAYNGANYLNTLLNPSGAPDLFSGAQQGASLFGGTGTNYSAQVFDQLNNGGSNPYLDQIIASMTSDVTDNFNQNVLPQISTQALADNSFGGSRQGIAEGLATQGLNEAIADNSGRLRYQDYTNNIAQRLQAGGQADQTSQALLNQQLQQMGFGAGLSAQEIQLLQSQQGLGFNAANLGISTLAQGQDFSSDSLTRALSLLPQSQQLALQGINTTGQAGQGYDAYSQALLQDDANAFNFYQQSPYDALARYVAAIQGQYGGTTTTEGPEQSGGGITGALGGAAAGAGIVSALPASMVAGPVGPIIVGGAALAGAFG